MNTNIHIDSNYMFDFLVDLLNIPSPTGNTTAAIDFVAAALKEFPLEIERTRKGALVATWPGSASTHPRALTAHVDTLGAMVRAIKSDGRLQLTKIGGFSWSSVEGEGVSVLTDAAETIRGTILPIKASVHIHGSEVASLDRKSDDAFEVRLDARLSSAEETSALGIGVGDFVAFDPRVERGPAGFIRSRHLDDKAGVAAILGAIHGMVKGGQAPAQRTTFLFSNYEEVGHGAATGFPSDLDELLTVDMAAVGSGQQSDEFSVGVCVKDSGGPYHPEMRRRIVQLAEAADIPYSLDIYPYYRSDGEAYWVAGGDVKVGLLGPGVDASHAYERTHEESVIHTARLLAEYISQP